MVLQYKACFDIIVQHDAFVGNQIALPEGQSDPVVGRAVEFEILPTTRCRKILEQYKLFFKSVSGGGLIVREFQEKGEGLVGAVPIKSNIPLSFYLKLVDSNLLNDTVPYKDEIEVENTEGELKLYFDSIDKELPVDMEEGDNPMNQDKGIRLSVNEKVSVSDFIGIIDNRYAITGSNLESIELLPSVPEAVPQNIPITADEINQKTLILEEGKYQISWRDNGNDFTISVVANSELANSNFLGMITIFKNELEMSGMDSELIARKYRVPFAK